MVSERSESNHSPAYDHAGNLIDDTTFQYVYDAWNRLIKVRGSVHTATTIQTAEFDATGRRTKKVVTNSGDLDRTEVYYWDGQKIVETRDGSANVVQQFIHGTQYIDELVMMRRKAESRRRRDEGESPAIGKADRDVRVRATTCPKQASTRRVRGGKGDVYVHQDANWNVVALTDLGGSVVERYVYTPYGEVTVHQNTSWGDYDGDGDVDANDKAAMLASPPGICRGASPAGACRLLDLDFDNDVDSNDETKFDALTSGTARHPGLAATGVEQPMAHQGLLFEPEIGSYQNRARQYVQSARRFAQRDPLGRLPMGDPAATFVTAPYSYVSSSPQANTDPSGLLIYCGQVTCGCRCNRRRHRVHIFADSEIARTIWCLNDRYGCDFEGCMSLPIGIHCTYDTCAGARADEYLAHECGHQCDLRIGWGTWVVGALPFVDYRPGGQGGLCGGRAILAQ